MFTVWRCLKCDWEWGSRMPLKPKYCARCRRVNWDRPRGERVQAEWKKPGAPGAPPKYPIGGLEVGQSILLPWTERMPNGMPDPRLVRSIHAAVSWEARKNNKRFFKTGKPLGLEVLRVK